MLKQFLPRTLFGRALLILLAPIILAQLVATYVFFERHWDNLSARLAYGVAGDISLITATLDEFADRPNRQKQMMDMIQRYTDLRVRITPIEPLPGHSDTTGMINNALDQALSYKFDPESYVIIDRTPEKLREVRMLTKQGLMTVEIPQRRLHSPTAQIFLLWMTGSAVFFFTIAGLFMRNQVRPIRRLAEAAESFGKGNEVVGFKPEGATEIRRAAQAFMLMRERIQRQITQRTEMLAGVSHDLRTPLTRMKLQLALLKPQPGIDELQQDIAEMEHMVEGYLAFARGEGGETGVVTDLGQLLESVVSDARRTDDSRSIELKGAAGCMLLIRQQAIKRCFDNLVGNALRYGNKVVLTFELAETAVFVHIDDDGPGIPPDKRPDVLRPFVRLEESRNQDTGGVGLGLTIARDIARAHGGDLMLEDSPLGGLRATVRLPR